MAMTAPLVIPLMRQTRMVMMMVMVMVLVKMMVVVMLARMMMMMLMMETRALSPCPGCEAGAQAPLFLHAWPAHEAGSPGPFIVAAPPTLSRWVLWKRRPDQHHTSSQAAAPRQVPSTTGTHSDLRARGPSSARVHGSPVVCLRYPLLCRSTQESLSPTPSKQCCPPLRVPQSAAECTSNRQPGTARQPPQSSSRCGLHMPPHRYKHYSQRMNPRPHPPDQSSI